MLSLAQKRVYLHVGSTACCKQSLMRATLLLRVSCASPAAEAMSMLGEAAAISR